MLKIATSDLFESPAQTLVNPVNTVGVMGKGLAAEFKRRYPAMVGHYQRFCAQGELTVGKLMIYRTGARWIVNLPTKIDWRHPSRLEYVEAGLARFREIWAEQDIASVAFPQLGCGSGGLDWDDVGPVMERYLADLPIPVWIHVAPAAAGVQGHVAGARLSP